MKTYNNNNNNSKHVINEIMYFVRVHRQTLCKRLLSYKKKILLKHVYEVYNVDNIILKMFLNLFKHVLV